MTSEYWSNFSQWLSTNAATIISICALTLTIWQIHLTRKHNVLSIRPRLTTSLDVSEVGGTTTITATLSNNGLGPAFIKSYEIIAHGKPNIVRQTEEVFDLIKANSNLEILPNSTFYVLRKEAAMATNQTLGIAKIITSSGLGEVETFISTFHLKVVYESAYGEVFTYDSRNHLG